MSYNPQDMALRGRIGAYKLHASHDSREITAAARRGFLARFDREVDPDSKLPPEERARRAEMALRAHMTQLSYRFREGPARVAADEQRWRRCVATKTARWRRAA